MMAGDSYGYFYGDSVFFEDFNVNTIDPKKGFDGHALRIHH